MTKKRKQSRNRWSRIEKIAIASFIFDAIYKILDLLLR